MIGLGGSTNGTGLSGPQATFCPEPNAIYQIEPINTYYLAWGKFDQGTMINYTTVSGTKELDFTKLPDEIVIVHDADNKFNIQE